MLGIFREETYSPNRVDDDATILSLTAEAIRDQGYPVRLIRPNELAAEEPTGLAFGMCEGRDSLKVLKDWEARGHRVVNSPMAVENCFRYRMLTLLSGTTVPFPNSLLVQTSEQVNGHFDLAKGVWVKRGDVHSTHPQDVQLIFDRSSLEGVLSSMRQRWIEQAVLQEHVRGDLLKFYGVLPQGWFKCFYHKANEVKGHPFSVESIRKTAVAAARMVGLTIFGGDIVITKDAHYLIDINSWPSFAVCREEAAHEIAASVILSAKAPYKGVPDLQRRFG